MPPDDVIPAAGPRRIRDYFARHRTQFLAGCAALVLTNLLGLSIPWLLKRAVDALELGEAQALTEATQFAGLMALAALLMSGIRVLSRVWIFNAGRKVEYRMRSELFDHLSLLPPSWFHRMSVGDVMSRAVNDLGQVRLLLGPGVLNAINTVVAYSVGLVLMVAIDPWLTLAALIPYPFLGLSVKTFATRLHRQSRAVQESLGAVSTYVQENLAGQPVVKSYVREAHAVEQFGVHNETLLQRSLRLAMTRGLMVPVFGLVGGVGTLVVLWFGGQAVIEGRISLGSLVAFNGYLAYLAWPTIGLGWMLSMWQRGMSAMERINEVFAALPEIADVDPEPIESIRGELEMRELSFTYDGAESPALTGISFHVPAGGSLGIVGLTGSGKSTLVDLLPRLKPVPDGMLFVDGVDINRIPLFTLRQAIGYAPQDPFLFSATVRENIAFGRPDASFEEVVAAAKRAAVHEDIEGFPRGYDTLVGERGVTLSGGQRQRVALARALLKDPRILVLDDSLSSVDADTESRILGGFEAMRAERTTVVVSHRVAAVMGCREILVLDEGRLAERGDHEALVESGGLYATLWRRQRLEEELEHGGETSRAASGGRS